MTILSTGVATEFINFTRASNATVVDSNGLIDWAAHNLLLASEQFDNSNWTKTNITLTANSIAAPNGTTTADKVAATASASTAIYQVLSNAPASFTYRLWVKKGSGATDANRFGVRNVTTSTDVLIVNVDYDTGAITYVTGSSGVTMTDAGSGWWLLSFVVTSGVTEGNQISLYAGFNFNGETAGEFNYLWGAHLYRSDMGMQANTSAYPMYNPTTPKNLLGYTEDFSNTAWTKGNTTVGATQVLAPNSLQTADLVYPATTGTFRSVYQASSGKTVSVYAKAAGKSYIAFVDTGAGSIAAWFNLSTGVKGTGTAGYEYDMVDEGDGWYRCWMRRTSGASFTYAQIYITDADNSNSVTANGTDGVLLWGAQLSDSASLDPYVPVYGAAVTSAAYYGPRRDFDGATLACKGLLVEEQRSNLMVHSNDMTQSIWTSYSAALSTTANSALGPDGLTTANTITLSANLRVNFFAVTSGLTYTLSVWLRTDSGTKQVTIGDANETAANSTVTVTTTWQRFTRTITKTNASAYVGILQNAGVSPSTSGTLYAWGWQFELGSFATSYIPTTTASATRSADVAQVSTAAFPYSATEGTVVVNATMTGTGAYSVTLNGAGNTGNDALYIYNSGGYLVQAYNSASLQANINTGVAEGVAAKIGAAYASNNFGLSANGGAVTSDPTYSQPTVDKLRIGSAANGSVGGQVYIRQITYIPRRLSNAELQARTV